MEDLLQKLKKQDAAGVQDQTAATAVAQTTRRRVECIMRHLTLYTCDMADPIIRDHVNFQLAAIPYRSFIDYYAKGNGLSAYSITKELDRMHFSVTFRGQTVTDVESILALYEQQSYATVWRLANQSIYADILIALQQHLVRPELSISIAATASNFVIDMDQNTVRAESKFLIVTVKEPSGNDRLELGSIDGVVYVNLTGAHVEQSVQSPSIRFVFDDDLRRAAEAIVELGSFDNAGEINNGSSQNTLFNNGFVSMTALASTGSTLLKHLTSEVSSSASLSSSSCTTAAATSTTGTAATAPSIAAAIEAGNPDDGGGSSAVSMANKLAERVVFSLGRILQADAQHPKRDDDQGFHSLLAGLKQPDPPAAKPQQASATTAGIQGDEWDEW